MDREKTYLQLFIDVTQAITSKLNIDEVFSLIAHKIPEVIGVDAATIRLLDTSGKKLVLHAASGLSDTYLQRGPVDTESSVMKARSPLSMLPATPAFSIPRRPGRKGSKVFWWCRFPFAAK